MLAICYFYRPLSDLPQAPAAETISQDSFQSKYLAPLLGKQANVIVAFLQDKVLKLQVQSKMGGGGVLFVFQTKKERNIVLSHAVCVWFIWQGWHGQTPLTQSYSDIDWFVSHYTEH